MFKAIYSFISALLQAFEPGTKDAFKWLDAIFG